MSAANATAAFASIPARMNGVIRSDGLEFQMDQRSMKFGIDELMS